jgi:hypothetical protein
MSTYRFFIHRESSPRHFRFWLTWILCLCAWRGPMPIVHRHSLESRELAANLNLAVHAVHHHSHAIGHGESGWHVHFVWPAASEDAPAGDDQAAPSLAWPCVLEELGHGSCALEFSPTQSLLAGLLVQSPVSLACVTGPAKPLPQPEIESKRISPQAALCVARC